VNVLQTILPIFILILTGFVLRRAEFPSSAFWPQAERLTYYVLFPALLVNKLTTMHIGEQPVLFMAATLLASITLIALALMAARPLVQKDGPAFTSIFQGAIRPNTYICLSAAGGLFGDEGLSLSAVALMTIIPTVNVLCVLVLTRHGRNTNVRGLRETLVQLGRNPPCTAQTCRCRPCCRKACTSWAARPCPWACWPWARGCPFPPPSKAGRTSCRARP
jgi:predicted permease